MDRKFWRFYDSPTDLTLFDMIHLLIWDSCPSSLFSTDFFVLKGDTAKLQNRNQEIASTRISGNKINQEKVFLKVCTGQN